MNILDLPMKQNEAAASTIRDYLKALLVSVWTEEESFSGKRPFGNSGWQFDIYAALISGGAIAGTLGSIDTDAADKLILSAIASL